MKVKVWGCRGSLPSPGPEKDKYGGNTSCVEVSHKDTLIVLDGGSGIQRLGAEIGDKYKNLHIFLSHLHIDHTMGLGFFLPLYNPKITVHIWGPASSEESLLDRLKRYFSPPLFPVRLSELPNHPQIHELHESEFELGDLKIKSSYVCHPSATLGYRLSCDKSTVAYMPDHEIPLGSCNFPNEPEWTSGYAIAKDADLLLHDAQYRPKEYASRIGWGHSSINDALEFAKMCNVKKVSFFHHDPSHSDDQIDSIFNEFIDPKKLDFEVGMCAEGDVYEFC